MFNQFFLVALISILGFDQELNCCKKSDGDILPSFYGQVLHSKDGGITWQECAKNLPKEGINMMASDKNKVYISYNKNSVYSKNMKDEKWKHENLDELLIDQSSKLNHQVSFFSTKNNFYADVIYGKLLRKNKSTSQWQPINKPDEHNPINNIKEDDKGALYVATAYGLYMSNDKGNSWEQIFKMGWVNDFEIYHGEIFISSVQGLMSSIDKGLNWKHHHLVGDGINLSKKASYNFSLLKDELILVKNSEIQDLLSSNNIHFYNAKNAKWNIHHSNAYLSNLAAISDIICAQNKIYCSYADGVVCSDDNGKSWKKILDYKPNERNTALKISITEDGIIYCCEVSLGC